ncbi:hypothetical protein KNSL1_005321 [Colletotrichum chrysophilum]|nr:hypothetical protein KNSL1_005321 [Colletotrichum chrysophilum]
MESSTTQSLLISLAIIVAVFAGGFFAYQQGMLDPIIEQIGVMMFKAKAEAEKKKLQAQGQKAGQDFVDGKSLTAATMGRKISRDNPTNKPPRQTNSRGTSRRPMWRTALVLLAD